MDFIYDDLVSEDKINNELADLSSSFFNSLDKQRQQEYLDMVAWYQTASLSDAVLKVNDIVPDMIIPTRDNAQKPLSEYLKNGPVVMIFFRSDWCDYCNYYLEVLNKAMPAFEGANAHLFAVTPEKTFSRTNWYQFNSRGFDIVQDTHMDIIDTFNVGYEVPDNIAGFLNKLGVEPFDIEKKWRLPLTGVFIIEETQRIAWRDLKQDYRYRVAPQQIMNALLAAKK